MKSPDIEHSVIKMVQAGVKVLLYVPSASPAPRSSSALKYRQEFKTTFTPGSQAELSTLRNSRGIFLCINFFTLYLLVHFVSAVLLLVPLIWFNQGNIVP
ncbi:hypothetical protein ILYODFUR_029839 [Ilyodon furcidens]|uniref:Uncharacterized protein n=1 Tax=Ilyodon furcidens TaxID=33524 RepID=A0ABV0UAA7_9TELE